MKYGAGSVLASAVNARFSSRCMVASTTSGVSPAGNAVTGIKLINESSTTVQLKANDGRRLIRLVGPLGSLAIQHTHILDATHTRKITYPERNINALGGARNTAFSHGCGTVLRLLRPPAILFVYSSDGGSESSSTMPKFKFFLSLPTDDNDYQQEQAAAARETAQRLGFDLEVAQADNDAIKQSDQILKAIQAAPENRPSAILFEPLGATALPQVARAAAT